MNQNYPLISIVKTTLIDFLTSWRYSMHLNKLYVQNDCVITICHFKINIDIYMSKIYLVVQKLMLRCY